MKKYLVVILLLLISIFVTSCNIDNNTKQPSDSSSDITENEPPENSQIIPNDNSKREIIKQETIDGSLWITYKDNPENPVCVGIFDESIIATEGLEYCLQNDGTYWISVGSARNIENIVVPSMHNEKAVTGIIEGAFSNCTAMKSILLPSTIKTIDRHAFMHCGLQFVEIPEGVETICEEAFDYCPKLVSASIPASAVNIEGYIFVSCFNLIEICNNSPYESKEVYCGVREIHSITDPKDSYLSIINDFIFYNDGTEIILCGYTGSPTDLTLPTNQTYSIHSAAFYEQNGIKRIVIPSNVTSIGQGAFEYCEDVEKIIIEVGVSSIDDYAFWGLSKAAITYKGTIEQWQKIRIISNGVDYNSGMRIPVHCSDGDA